MSTPVYNGGLVGGIDGEGRPYIQDDGNWSLQGNEGGPRFRALLLALNGAESFGYRPSAQREPFAQATARPGVWERQDLLSWKGPVLSPGTQVEMILTGGDRYLGWGDTAGEDWMEWGSISPVTLRPILASTGILTVPGQAAPPDTSGEEPPSQVPPPGGLPPDLEAMVHNVNVERSLAKAKDLNAWRKDNPKEFEAWWAFICAEWKGESEAPDLRTHPGRWLVGRELEAQIAHDHGPA